MGFTDIEEHTWRDGEKMREAIEVLAQEPFMNKPCVANQVCHEDKIKVLDNLKKDISCLHDDAFTRYHILRIIDNYRTGSEVEE